MEGKPHVLAWSEGRFGDPAVMLGKRYAINGDLKKPTSTITQGTFSFNAAIETET